MEESIIKRLIASIKCSACDRHYGTDNINILGHQGELWFLGVSCSACHSQYLVAAIIKEEVARLVTDLTEAELDKFRDTGVPTADEMLDMHNFLKDFNGDFSRLFEQR